MGRLRLIDFDQAWHPACAPFFGVIPRCFTGDGQNATIWLVAVGVCSALPRQLGTPLPCAHSPGRHDAACAGACRAPCQIPTHPSMPTPIHPAVQVSLSSLNRHAVATRADVGLPKATVLKRHFATILPEVNACHSANGADKSEHARAAIIHRQRFGMSMHTKGVMLLMHALLYRQRWRRTWRCTQRKPRRRC